MSNTLIVIDDDLEFSFPEQKTISFSQYVEEYPQKHEGKVIIINLCNTTHYLSKGYYCSLLAEARKHKVLPSINTTNDLRNQKYNLLPIPESILKTLPDNSEIEQHTKKIKFYFGNSEDVLFQKLAHKLFSLFPTPILEITLKWKQSWTIDKIAQGSFAKLTHKEREQFSDTLLEFTETTWRNPKAHKNFRWDMAILIDPEQKLPPSDKSAIQRFIKAAAKLDIAARIITEKDYSRIPEFNALFIRETTAIDHYTYRFARKAELEGLVVIDDSTSILRCCNKVFLHDAFTYHDVPALQTMIVMNVNSSTIVDIEEKFSYPMILKLPESSFSKGVYKAINQAELINQLSELLTSTSLVLVQEYFYTEFDWRIGVLNGRCIFACKYFMAKDHWQIYNHQSETKHDFDGYVTTLPTFEVPKSVLEAALKACKIIGNGLYGVDIKQHNKQAFVIEVNDNPSIEHKIEDIYLGDELYMIIMSEFARRLESRGK